MNTIRIRYLHAGLAVGAMLALGVAGHAQRGQDFSQVEITTTRIADNLYTLTGQGGITGALVGPDGVLLVDTQFAPLTEKIVAAVRALSPSPIRFAINTHLHGDHTGGNANLAAMGVIVMSRDQLRAGMARNPNTAAPALPKVTYDDTVTFHMNGEVVEAIPIRGAHTDGDTLVRFRNADVLMTGDYFRSVGYPNIDRNNGGTLEGMIAGLGQTLGMAGPNTRIIPGHGPTVDRDALRAHRDMMLAVRDQIAPMVARGMTLDEVVAARPTAAYDSVVEGGEGTSERFIGQVYAELGGGQ